MQPEQPQPPQMPPTPVPRPEPQPTPPTMPPQQPVMPQQPTPAPQQGGPSMQFEGWTVPPGKKTSFAYRKCHIALSPGLMVVTDAKTHAELSRMQLARDLKVMNFLGWVYITFNNGQKYSLWGFRFNNGFMFSHIGAFWTLLGGTAVGAILNAVLLGYGYRTTIGTIISAVGLIWFLFGIPKTARFAKAIKQAAGVA